MPASENIPSDPMRLTASASDWPGTTGDLEAEVRGPGSNVGDYIVLNQIGAGGMGVVYAAYDPHLDRKIALKVMRHTLELDDLSMARARMVREGRALARVSHPNVVAIHDVGLVDDGVYIAMELVDGDTLTSWREAQPRSWPEIIAVFLEIAAGLIEVHDAGLVHRDVKPDNVLIDKHGRARVTDFGLARAHGEAQSPLDDDERGVVTETSSGPVDLTRTGARLGTPAYMAREVLQFGNATADSDQFSFCVALWECLYGIRPFAGDNWISLIVSVENGAVREPPTPAAGKAVPPWLRRIVRRGLAAAPEDRWPSMRDLTAALAAGDPDRRRRRLLAGGGLIVVGAACAGLLAYSGVARERDARAACHRDAQAITERWTTEDQEAIATAFASDPAVGQDIAARLDRYVQQWAEDRETVCAASLDDPPMDAELQARSLECLDQHRGVFDSLVRTFGAADDIVVARAQKSSEGLNDLSQCRDETRLRSLPERPDDPRLRAQVSSLHEELAQTKVHEHVGRYAEGLDSSRKTLERALATEHLPLIAVARYRVAVFLEKLGEYEDAVDSWVGAFHDATLVGHDQLAAEAATALAFCEGYQLSRYDAGLRWAEVAGVFLERLGLTETLTEASRLDVLAVLREMKGDYPESIATHHRALDLRRELAGPDHQSIAFGSANLAGVLRKTGELDQARRYLVDARRIFEAKFGPDNPTTAHVLNNLGTLHQELGDYTEAEAMLEQVREIWTATLGADHPDVGDVHNSLASLRRAEGKLDAAIDLHAKALAIHRSALPSDHPTPSHTAIKLGQALALRGREADARARFEEALTALRSAGPDHRDGVGRALVGLGRLDLSAGNKERAAARFEASVAEFRAHHDDHANWVARGTIGVAASLVLRGELVDANKKLDGLADNADIAMDARAEAAAWQARAAVATGDTDAVEGFEARARALAQRDGPLLQARIDALLGPDT